MKVNTDVSVFCDNLKATVGGVVRGSAGKWIWAFSSNIGCMEVDRAELYAVKMGMQVAWEHQIPKSFRDGLCCCF